MAEPTQHEIERAFYRILDNGDESAIARETGKSLAYISSLYSPDSERESTLFRAIRELRAWRREHMGRGEEALETFVYFVEHDLEPEPLCVATETRNLKKEVDEWETAEMESASPTARIEQIRDVHIQADRTIKANIQELRGLAKNAIERNGRQP